MVRQRGIAAYGGEVPIECAPHTKHVIQRFTPLEHSILWNLLTAYYKKVALSAWSSNYVPMFVTSNSRLAKSYAEAFFHFLKDLYSVNPHTNTPVYLIEVGAGHGRFTYLFLRHILRTRSAWPFCNIPEHPFVYVYTDVAEANIAFCKRHRSFQTFIKDGWLDFCFFDANHEISWNPAQLHLHIADTPLPQKHPLVLIANYVLDSLFTDALRISQRKVDARVELLYERSFVQVYSQTLEPDLQEPDIASRMSLQWEWRPIDVPPELTHVEHIAAIHKQLDDHDDEVNDDARFLSTENAYFAQFLNGDDDDELHHPQSRKEHGKNEDVNACPDYILQSPHIQNVLKFYAAQVMNSKPLERLCLYHDFSLMCLIGDKGYRDMSEFRGPSRYPHIAIHGAISFMVNLHALRLFIRSMSGWCIQTPYRDTFQITLSYIFRDLPSRYTFGTYIAYLLLEIDAMPPDLLVCWQRYCQEQMISKKRTAHEGHTGDLDIKTLLGLLRFSAHDPEVFLTFSKVWVVLSSSLALGVRSSSDIVRDLERVFENWYPLDEEQDLPDVIGHLCMKIGRLDRAIFFFKESLLWCPTQKNPATYVNIAACYKALDQMEHAKQNVYHALQLNPKFLPAIELDTQLQMCHKKLRVAFVGCGHTMTTIALPLLMKDHRVCCVAYFSFQFSAKEELQKRIATHKGAVDQAGINFYCGTAGFQELMDNPDIDACVVDVHPRLMLPLLTRLWKAGKHTFALTPFSFSTKEVNMTLGSHLQCQPISNFNSKSSHDSSFSLYSPKPIVSCLLTRFSEEDAFKTAIKWIQSHPLGQLVSASYQCTTEKNVHAGDIPVPDTPDQIKELLAVDLFNGIVGILMLLPHLKLLALSVFYTETAQSFKSSDKDTAPCITAWMKFTHAATPFKPAHIVGNAFCSQSIRETSLHFFITFVNGTLFLERVGSLWKVTLQCESESKQLVVPAEGFVNSCHAWLMRIYHETIKWETAQNALQSHTTDRTTDKLPCPELRDPTTATMPISLLLEPDTPTTLVHTSILEAIFASLERSGSCLSLCRRPPTVDTSLLQKVSQP